MRILVVEDESKTGAYLKKGLAESGFVVDLARTGVDGRQLAQHQGEVQSRSLIASQVWDMNFDSDTNVVDVAVRRLRAKIDDPYAKKLVHTVRGVGYVLEQR